MENITTVGLDLAKGVFHWVGVNRQGKEVYRRKANRENLIEGILKVVPQGAVIAMEACGSANYWSRQFRALGYQTRLIAPQHVKPYRMSQKNDMNDALAIAEAATRPVMRFVEPKNEQQQELALLVNLRDQAVKRQTALMNQLRGILLEFGLVIGQGKAPLKRFMQDFQNENPQVLSQANESRVRELYADIVEAERRERKYTDEIKTIAKCDEICRLLMTLPGVGPIISVTLRALVPNPKSFADAREFAAWLGLVPRQNSTGGRTVLGPITKRGDRALRALLVHGARAVVRRAKNKTDQLSLWVNALKERCHVNVVTVALANKLARIIWRIMVDKTCYQEGAFAKTREQFAAA